MQMYFGVLLGFLLSVHTLSAQSKSDESVPAPEENSRMAVKRDYLINEGKSRVLQVRFSPDGKTFASWTEEGNLKLWDSESGKNLWALPVKVKIPAVTTIFTPDGSHIAVGQQEGGVVLVDVKSGKPGKPLFPFKPAILGMAFTPDGKKLVYSGFDGQLGVWDIAQKKILQTTKNTHARDLEVSPDGKLFSFPSNDGLQLWNVDTLTRHKLIKPESGSQTRLLFVDDQTLIGYVDASGLRLWNIADGKVKEKVAGIMFSDLSHALSRDRKTLITRNGDYVDAWDMATGQLKTRITEKVMAWSRDAHHRIDAMAVSPDGSRVLLGTGEGAIASFSFKNLPIVKNKAIEIETLTINGVNLERIPLGPEMEHIGNNPALSLDGKLLFFVQREGNQVHVWDLSNRTLKQVIPASSGYRFGKYLGVRIPKITSITPSPDGKLVLIGSTRTTLLWDVEKNRQLADLAHGDFTFHASFSPDGTQFAINSENSNNVYQTSDRKLLAKLSNCGGVPLFLGKNNFLITAEHNNRVHLWDLDIEAQVTEDHPDLGPLEFAQLFQNETMLMVGGQSGVRIYEVQTKKGEEKLKQVTNMTGLGLYKSVHLSSNGEKAVICGIPGFSPNYHVLFHDMKTNKTISKFPITHGVFASAMTLDAKLAVVLVRKMRNEGDHKPGIYLWKLEGQP